ncbi:MAG: hypothetical protein AAB270_00265 [Chloroflexota bacterium]
MVKHNGNLRTQRGLALIESVVALGVLGMFVVVLLGGVSASARSIAIARENIVAQSLALSQLEYTRSLPFQPPPATYTTMPGVPAGYAVEARAEPYPGGDSNIELIVVTVYRGERVRLVVESLKANW